MATLQKLHVINKDASAHIIFARARLILINVLPQKAVTHRSRNGSTHCDQNWIGFFTGVIAPSSGLKSSLL